MTWMRHTTRPWATLSVSATNRDSWTMPIVGDRLLQPCDPSGDLPERDQGDRRDKVSLRRHRVADASLAGSDGGGPWAVRVVPRTRHPAEGPALTTRVAACFVLAPWTHFGRRCRAKGNQSSGYSRM